MKHIQNVVTFFTLLMLGTTSSHILNMVKEYKDVHRFFNSNEALDMEKASGSYIITDKDGYGRTFDGVGAVSGGGATSRLLVNYAEPYRSQILDYLFKPQFGASLHILKVEIGGDAQSTDGSEPSHMHTADDLNFTRGYEWWLMKEAKARNPDIKLIGLPWGWPGWIAGGYVWPYQNIDVATKYIITWIQGAKSEHGLNIDYIGIWNEKPFTPAYVIALRKALNDANLSSVKIIAADEARFGEVVLAGMMNKELYDSIDVYGAHYLGTQDLNITKNSGKPLWSSEDYSTYDDNVGAGCWARILNQNYVNGKMTATLAWNLVASYYDDLPFNRTSLLTANEPWSGHYEVVNPIWITAHTTQFTQPGWSYLKSVGHLEQGGSYVSLTDKNGQLTIIVETMKHDMAVCVRPPLLPYTVEIQTASFALTGSFLGKVEYLHMWQTDLSKTATDDDAFKYKGKVPVNENGKFIMIFEPNTVTTLTTIATGAKGSYSIPPASAKFPFPYEDNFDTPNGFSEPNNFADQSGSFETYHNASSQDGHEWTMRQVVPEMPVSWCDDSNSPITVIGDYGWNDVNVTVEAKIESASGVFVAARVDTGGCDTRSSHGAFLWLFNGSWLFSTDINRSKQYKRCHFGWDCWHEQFLDVNNVNAWHSISIAITGSQVIAHIDGIQVLNQHITNFPDLPSNGFAAIGTANFGYAQFDNFSVK